MSYEDNIYLPKNIPVNVHEEITKSCCMGFGEHTKICLGKRCLFLSLVK